MGWQYRRSIKVGGIRLNLGSKSWGISTGVRGLRVSANSKSRNHVSVGIPGTGLSYRQRLGLTPKQASQEKIPLRQTIIGWLVLLCAINPFLGSGALILVILALPFITLYSIIKLTISVVRFAISIIWVILVFVIRSIFLFFKK